MRQLPRRPILFLLAGLAAAPVSAVETGRGHRVVFQVDTADPATMNLTLNNATNVVDHYRAKNEAVEIDIVAFGPGLAMYRADKSTVADRIAHFAESGFPSKIQFSACNNTKTAMEKAEGHPIPLLPQVTIVPSGVVQIMERQEQGWSYVRP
ncbi:MULTISPECIES: hypothetical protein [Methylobacterium]|jgi:intracellular sulfur oxidation DsrE/DsrF family protein|uniref:Protein of unassigned function n=1 Tax=Methylobacterium oryzae CBMB20 TaxID=693986 RepID=A0A089NX44_9HYPH|nr:MULTISPECIES: hypothetical protein [Methylobacterium]AIQ92506.1 protein of unassigned function [Methylobacterium oryzae CBMB20]KOX54622.1 hypothetical protein ADL19_13730 [Streptomyces purpurogeneiscleroticus]MBP32188.1 hypothetical protein [Methylobacterium sp.]